MARTCFCTPTKGLYAVYAWATAYSNMVCAAFFTFLAWPGARFWISVIRSMASGRWISDTGRFSQAGSRSFFRVPVCCFKDLGTSTPVMDSR